MKSRDYEDQTAAFFRGLGCDVNVRARIKGARATHTVDVWVVFARFGLCSKWVVECKCWQTNVPKEKVLALKALVEDVGADRGILVSQMGFQSGAVRAAELTNIHLTGLDDLKERVQEELVLSTIYTMEKKTIQLENSLHGLYVSEKTGPDSIRMKPLPGVNGREVLNTLGKLSLLKSGFERARISAPPFLVEIDASGEREFAAMTIQELVERASIIIADARSTLERNRPR
jgi:hypothetical protein